MKPENLLCAKCGNYVAFSKPDLTKPAVRCEFWNGSAKEAQWNMLRPMQERTGMELCYTCDKVQRKLMTM